MPTDRSNGDKVLAGLNLRQIALLPHLVSEGLP